MQEMSRKHVIGWLLLFAACSWYANEIRIAVVAVNEFGQFQQIVKDSSAAAFEQKIDSEKMMSDYKNSVLLRGAFASIVFMAGIFWGVRLIRSKPA